MAQQAAVTEYSKLEGTHKDHWVQLLMKWPVMDGTIPKISKCMFFIDEKMHISSHRARKSQSKSNLLCQKTKPKPPKTTNREQILWKADGLTLSKLWAACTHHSLWEHIPKEQALLHVGCYWLKWFRENFFFFLPCSFSHQLFLVFWFCLCNQGLSLLTTTQLQLHWTFGLCVVCWWAGEHRAGFQTGRNPMQSSGTLLSRH